MDVDEYFRIPGFQGIKKQLNDKINMKTVKSTIAMLLFSIPFLSYAKKDIPNTVISQNVIINAGISKVWQILGPEFADAYKWATAIKHSQAINTESIHGSTCSERGCDVSGFGSIKEKILGYSETDHVLHYQVTEGMPGMVSYMSNFWKLTETKEGKTKLEMRMEMKPKGFMGILMKGMMKRRMTMMSKEIVEEFTYYVENGVPHPRKVKAAK